jgi:hypothetical protein
MTLEDKPILEPENLLGRLGRGKKPFLITCPLVYALQKKRKKLRPKT